VWKGPHVVDPSLVPEQPLFNQGKIQVFWDPRTHLGNEMKIRGWWTGKLKGMEKGENPTKRVMSTETPWELGN